MKFPEKKTTLAQDLIGLGFAGISAILIDTKPSKGDPMTSNRVLTLGAIGTILQRRGIDVPFTLADLERFRAEARASTARAEVPVEPTKPVAPPAPTTPTNVVVPYPDSLRPRRRRVR